MQRIWMKLALILMFVSGGGILLSTLLSVKEMDYHFSMYVQDMNSMYAHQLVQSLQKSYSREHGFGQEAKQIVKEVSDVMQMEVTVYESAQPPADRTITSYPIVVNQQAVGYLSIQPGRALENHDLETHFQTAHTQAMIWTMIILTVLVCVVSLVVAKRMVRPVIEMSRAARQAERGDLSVQVKELSSTDELSDLVSSFNQLVVTLKAQDELRKRLTSDIAHELRTPLNTILAQVEGMIDGIWAATPEHLESTRGEVLRLSRLVNDLDQIIQAEAGENHLQIHMFDLADLLREVVNSMYTSFERAGVALKLQCEAGINLSADRQRIAQILVNLLSNSLKHTPGGGVVTVRGAQLPKQVNQVTIQVEDTGSGIAQKDIPFVFQRFYRGDRSRQRETGGSGLGLTIVRGLTHAHHGNIEIDSQLGKGTIVTITLPQTFHQG